MERMHERQNEHERVVKEKQERAEKGADVGRQLVLIARG